MARQDFGVICLAFEAATEACRQASPFIHEDFRVHVRYVARGHKHQPCRRQRELELMVPHVADLEISQVATKMCAPVALAVVGNGILFFCPNLLAAGLQASCCQLLNLLPSTLSCIGQGHVRRLPGSAHQGHELDRKCHSGLLQHSATGW